MKLPNGFGSVYKLPGKRRKPWAASKTTGWEIDTKTNQAKQVKKAIGYFSTRKEALKLLPDITKIPTIYLPKNPLLVMCTKHGLMYISLPWVVLPVSVLLLLHISTVLHYTISK